VGIIFLTTKELMIVDRSQASRAFDMPTSFQSEMNDDHLYRDPEYSSDEYIQA